MQLKPTLLRLHHCSRRRFCAAALSAVYVALYVAAALCLGTGVFHPEVADQTASHGHHDHGHSHHGHHHGPAADDGDTTPSAALPDICDFSIQALTEPVYPIEYQSLHVLSRIEIVSLGHDQVIPILLRLGRRSRAPPLDAPLVA